MTNLAQNIRLASRGFLKTKVFSVTTLLILGIGIGTAAAMFTVSRAVLLRPLPVSSQNRIVVLRTLDRSGTEVDIFPGELKQLAAASQTLRSVAGVVHWGAQVRPLVNNGQILALSEARVSGSFFDVLGGQPELGRFLRPEDDVVGAAPVMVLSYRAWQQEFGASPSIIGHRLTYPSAQSQYTIVGVAPAGLDYPVGVGYWVPSTPLGFAGVDVLARLAPGVTLAAARAEFLTIMTRVERANAVTAGAPPAGADVRTLSGEIVGEVQPMLVALSAAVVLLLLIACVNVGNLLLLRVGARSRGFAVRRALGATRSDIFRQLIVEHGILAVCGGMLGVVCGDLLRRAIVAWAPPGLPRVDVIALAGLPLGFAASATLFAVVLFGIIPAVVGSNAEIGSTLRIDERSGRTTTSRRRLRNALVVTQIALAVILLAGAGLLVRTLQRLERQPLGYRVDHLEILQLAIPFDHYDSSPKLVALLEQIFTQLGALHGVTAVTPILLPPFQGQSVWVMKPQIEGRTHTETEATPTAPIEIGDADYFRAFDIPIVHGRGFFNVDREGAPRVAVVSEAFARRYFPADPIGKRFRNSYDPSSPWMTIVGVAGDIHYRTLKKSTPTIYLPWRQLAPAGTWVHLAVRTTGAETTALPAIRQALRAIDPGVSLWRTRAMDELLAEPLAKPRMSAWLLSGFGIVALLLSALGLYGVMASAVREQVRDLGIKLALGATARQLRQSVIREALVLTLVGASIGVAVALTVTRLLTNLLFEVSPSDPTTLCSVVVILVAVSWLAAYVPARRATAVDPMRVLRAD